MGILAQCFPTPGQSVTAPEMIDRERKIDFALPDNQNDHPVTISRKHIMIAGETILISGRPGSNEDESVDHFIKTITIAGNHKSIFTMRKNDFAKEKNQNYLSDNRSCGNILQEDGNKLKEDDGFFPEAGNVLKED